MIEDKNLGLKIAENSSEKFWTTVKERCEKAITDSKHEIEINEHLILLANLKINEAGR